MDKADGLAQPSQKVSRPFGASSLAEDRKKPPQDGESGGLSVQDKIAPRSIVPVMPCAVKALDLPLTLGIPNQNGQKRAKSDPSGAGAGELPGATQFKQSAPFTRGRFQRA